MIKGRNEPCRMIEVLKVVSKIKNVDEEELAAITYRNTCKLFGIDETIVE